jgi:hypothetical protein
VSLLSSVDVVADADAHMANGIVWQPEPSAPDVFDSGADVQEHNYWWACPDTIPADETTELDEIVGAAPEFTKDPSAACTGVEAEQQSRRAYDVWVGLQCGSQPQRGDELYRRTLRALEAFQSYVIERELWTGEVARAAGFNGNWPYGTLNNPYADGHGNSWGFVNALSILEQHLAEHVPGQTGVIHAMPGLVSLWVSGGLVIPEPSGRRLRTALGTIVVPGGGYTGDRGAVDSGVWDPDVSEGSSDSSTAYATGMVRVYLGAVSRLLGDDGEAAEHDLTVNTQTVRLERSVVTMFDPCTLARVGVDHHLAVGNSD